MGIRSPCAASGESRGNLPQGGTSGPWVQRTGRFGVKEGSGSLLGSGYVIMGAGAAQEGEDCSQEQTGRRAGLLR